MGFGLRMRGSRRAELDRSVDGALRLVRLADESEMLRGKLSGGKQRRVAIPRAIVIEPPLVLMDEPLSNLDAKLRLEMRQEIRRIHGQLGSTTIYVTHDQEEALSLADRIVVLRDGVIRQVGTPAELYATPAHLDVADFMGYRNRIDGRLVCNAGGLAEVDIGGATVQGIPRGMLKGERAIVAVRPDDLIPAKGGKAAIAATVEAIEYRGREFHGLPGTTMKIALPVTILNLALAIPIAFRVRLMRRQRLLTTILVLPITLGTVLVAEGMLFYFGPQGWFNRTLLTIGLISQPVRLVHNYWGVLISLVITGFPFTFLLTLSYITGIDPSLEQAAATLAATPASRFRHIFWPLLLPGLAITFCLSFVQAYSVFPSAVLVGEPAAAARGIPVAAVPAA